MPKSLLEYALLYQKMGFSVIPLQADKRPYFEWKEYQQRLATAEELRSWFTKYPTANIGIVTGQVSGIVVLDVDVAGLPVFRSLQALRTIEFNTPTVSTGGGGYHLYFSHPGVEVGNFQAREDLKGVDFRGDGGYVVAPPSVHVSGQTYEWVRQYEIDTCPLQSLPELFLASPEYEKAPLVTLYGGKAEGGRNQALARLAGSWVADGLSMAECLELAQIWNVKNNPPLGEKEVETTVKSIYAKHYSKYETFDVAQILQSGSYLKSLDTRVEWCLDRLIPRQSITLIAGKGGVGKSWLCLQLAQALVRGLPYLGLKAKKTPVTYIDLESPLPVLVERIRCLGIADVQFWHTTSPMPPPRLDSNNYELYKQMPLGVLIFDSLRAAHLKDENASNEMCGIMTRLKELRDCGFTIIVLHHTPKAGNRIIKGSTAIVDLADHVLTLASVTDKATSKRYCRLGTQDKTRYRPYQVFVELHGEDGFELVQNKAVLARLKQNSGEI